MQPNICAVIHLNSKIITITFSTFCCFYFAQPGKYLVLVPLLWQILERNNIQTTLKSTTIHSMSTQTFTATSLLVLATSIAPITSNFTQYKQTFHKKYNTLTQETKAYNAYQFNDAFITKHNQEYNLNQHTYYLGHNQFSDLTNLQFKDLYLNKFQDNPTLHRPRHYNYSLLKEELSIPANTSIDWTTKNAVTAIKNQGICGSCWSFAATGAIEGAFAINKANNNTLLELSMQQVISCDTLDHGCDGGLMDNAYDWVHNNHSLCTYDSYSYTSGMTRQSGTCNTSCTGVVSIQNHTDIPSEKGMMAGVLIGPVSVGIEADMPEFQLYKGGVMNDPNCGTQLDHGVLVVGFGTDDSLPYWKVKNSWGSSWGEDGYLRMIRNKNMCGIGNSASFPTGVTNSTSLPTPFVPSSFYTVSAYGKGSMPIWSFFVEGNHVNELKDSLICLNGGQLKLGDAISAVGNNTLCNLQEHTAFRSLGAVGDQFYVGSCL